MHVHKKKKRKKEKAATSALWLMGLLIDEHHTPSHALSLSRTTLTPTQTPFTIKEVAFFLKDVYHRKGGERDQNKKMRRKKDMTEDERRGGGAFPRGKRFSLKA